jgi:hypothetical protein
MPATRKDPQKAEYRQWYREVSRLCEEHLGIALSDLPDLLTRDAFDNGTTPEQFFDDDVAELVMEEFGPVGVTLIENYEKKRSGRARLLKPAVNYEHLD